MKLDRENKLLIGTQLRRFYHQGRVRLTGARHETGGTAQNKKR